MPPLAGSRKKILRKINKNETEKGPFKIKWTKSGDFSKICRYRMVSEGCNFCRIFLYADDQA